MQPLLIAGIDSSTQSCKVIIRDIRTWSLVRHGRAAHPSGTEVDPRRWWTALELALKEAGGLEGVVAISVAGQQHGMVSIDENGEIIRDALLWNDLRTAEAAIDLIAELGGPEKWVKATGSVPVAAFTVSKLRWLAENEPAHARRLAAVALPHDWLSWRMRGGSAIRELRTDRGDASGTCYYSPSSGEYQLDLVKLALGVQDVPYLPEVMAPNEAFGVAASLDSDAIVAAGTGDNMAAALGVDAQPGDVVVSLGTSGTAFMVSERQTHDETGTVAGFADATGRFLPLVCTLNAARVIGAIARTLNVSLEDLSRLAFAAPPGAHGLSLLPYLEGERTPNRPDASGVIAGLTLSNTTPEDLARAAIEGVLCGLADAIDALLVRGAKAERVILIGGAARSETVANIASAIFGREVVVPHPGEYVAEGAIRQALWALQGQESPARNHKVPAKVVHAVPTPEVRERYSVLKQATIDWHA